MKNIGISETPGIYMHKKMMELEDYKEFIDMALSFAEKKSMTISNIKDAMKEVVTCLEDNATLSADLGDQSYNEADRMNDETKLNTESFLIDDCLSKLENSNLSVKEREELLKLLPSGIRILFSGEPIKEPKCLKHYQYQKHGNRRCED